MTCYMPACRHRPHLRGILVTCIDKLVPYDDTGTPTQYWLPAGEIPVLMRGLGNDLFVGNNTVPILPVSLYRMTRIRVPKTGVYTIVTVILTITVILAAGMGLYRSV